MADWTVVHYNHDDVALGDVTPNSLEFAIYLNKVGYCNYQMDTDHPLCTKDNTEPYATDWKLFRGSTPLTGGQHTDIELGEEIEEHTLQVSGKDWLHYFETRFWPFDPTQPTFYDYLVVNADVFNVVADLLDTILAQPNSPSFTYNFGTSGNLINYKIGQADNEYILNKLTVLGQRTPGGFDFEITHDRVIKLYAPAKGILRDIVLEQGSNLLKMTYHDSGPTGTHTLAVTNVNGVRAAAAVDHINQTKYRRMDYFAEIPDQSDTSIINSIAAGESERAGTPHTEFTCTIVPEFLDDLLDKISIGDSCRVRGDVEYTVIDDDYRLVSIVGRPDDEGNPEYELGFDDGTISL